MPTGILRRGSPRSRRSWCSYTRNFAADGIAYFKKRKLHLELYTDYKSVELEERIETVLESHGLFYARSEVWIESEQLYEVLYEMEV